MLLFSRFFSTIKAMHNPISNLGKTLSKRYEMRIFFLPAVLVIALVTCAPTQTAIREELNESITKYNDLVRWHKLDAARLFPADAISEEFSTRAKAAKNVRVVDYRVVRMNYDMQTNEALVQVEIDYYTLTANRLRSLIDNQKWAYVTENGIKQWKLMSLQPEFP